MNDGLRETFQDGAACVGFNQTLLAQAFQLGPARDGRDSDFTLPWKNLPGLSQNFLTFVRHPLDWNDEPVTNSGQGFDELGALGRVRERLPQFLDCGVHTELEINKRIFRPQHFSQFFAGNDLSSRLQQQT